MSDEFDQFLSETINPAEGRLLKTSELYEHYRDWVCGNGFCPMRIQDFARELRKRCDVRRYRYGNIVFGVALKNETAPRFKLPYGARKKKEPEISADWLEIEQLPGYTDKTANAGLRVKVGMYAFEADAGFPMEKLAELLRGLGGEASSGEKNGIIVITNKAEEVDDYD